MNLTDEVKKFLEKDIRFRERKNKNVGIAILLLNQYPTLKHYGEVKLDLLVDVIKDYATMDRAWRKLLEENVHLRGSDYDVDNSKDILEQNKMIELGYEPKMYKN